MTPQRTVHSLSATRRESAVEDQFSTGYHSVPVTACERAEWMLEGSLYLPVLRDTVRSDPIISK